EVQVFFKDGNIVKGESATRKRKDLIGAMLVRAEVITESQLQDALEVQKRSLRRLGDVLVDDGMITADRFRQILVLQTTETLNRLFSWKTGKYQFVAEENVDWDPAFGTPLRAESVLMEGFRIVDEWPLIRRRITSDAMVFEKAKPLPPRSEPPSDSGSDGLDDDEWGALGGGPQAGDGKTVGEAERTVYALIAPGRDVRRLIDLSCLGEFETCKALSNLMGLELVRTTTPAGASERVEGAGGGLGRIGAGVGRWAGAVAALVALVFILTRIELGAFTRVGNAPSSYADPAAQRLVSRAQVSRIASAVELYRLEQGELPRALESLVEQGFLESDDLRYPWKDPYYYRRVDPRQFILLPPLR
ncbi:MAG TPA: DUF4388 domain-containing protein, partial [Myxococcaceae bacterium]|nr:DUF4388 domain-containing protein [Myxococcaceae bacterium]